MPELKDLTGKQFGFLTVLSLHSTGRRVKWLCRCECGAEVVTRGDGLRNGHATSCGKCSRFNDLTGHVYGKLTVLLYSHTNKRGAFWSCRCECGAEKIIAAGALRSGNVTSCGCRTTDRNKRRGDKMRSALLGSENLVGLRFGALTVIERSADANGKFKWLCRCDCGKEVLRESHSLTGWQNTSCGCRKAVSRRRDLTGQRFGRLVAIERDEQKSANTGRACWRCVCDCGNTTSVGLSTLVSGHSQSCGCLQAETSSWLGATYGVHNATAAGRYDWHVKVNGKRVTLRSSFEVIFAKYLLKHRIRFEYEPQRIQLDAKTIYIPDFYLPDTDTWVEVKGYASDAWKRKRTMFERTGRRLVVVSGATIGTYLDGVSYGVWMKRNSHKYLRA